MRALTRVGRVRMMLSSRRMAATTARLWMMLVEASMAKGTTSTEPMKEPSSDILMVSNRGPQIWDIYSHLGGIIWPRMTKNSPMRRTRTPRSKPVTSTDTAAMTSSTTA